MNSAHRYALLAYVHLKEKDAYLPDESQN